MPTNPCPPRVARAVAAGLTLVLAIASGGLARGQAAKAATPAPAGTPTPLAGYVPGGELFLYLEFAGLDAHADAWKRTAAYKILNDTPTGAMLEDVFAQVINQPSKETKIKVGGTEAVALVKHVARYGIVLAGWGKTDLPGGSAGVLVVRGVFKNKDVRPVIARLLGSMADPKVKPKVVDVAGHKIVMVKMPKGEFSGWWVDDARKEDLVLIPSMNTEAAVIETAGAIFATLDGQKPSALDDPKRVALAKEEDGFVPVGFAFLDLGVLPPVPAPPDLGLQGLKALDYRWGFQDKETVSITRITAPKPRQGLLALFDQPTFDKANLPPVPEGVTEFGVFSLDATQTFDRLSALAKALNPQAGAHIDAVVDQVKAKTRLRLKEDILAHIGPKVAVYIAPSKASAGDTAKAAGFSPLTAMLGGATIPRLTIIADVDNPTAFARTLDELMIYVNQSLRSAIPSPGAAAPGDTPKKGARAASSGLEFKLVPGPNKTFMLSVPSELSALIPSYVRPTIRMGGKHVVFSISPEAARQALEVKGAGVSATTYASTLQAAPANLLFLSVSDPTETLPTALASFPGKLQTAINKARNPAPPMTMPAMPGPGGPGAGSGPSGYPGPGSGSGSGSGGYPGSGSGSGSGSGGYPGSGSGSGSGGYPGSGSGSGGYPGSGSGSGSGGAPAAESDSSLVLKVDAAKLPSAAAIKPLLFAGSTAVAIEESGLRIVTREAFPNLGSMVSGNSISSMISQKLIPPGPGAGLPPGAGGPPPGNPAGGPAPGGGGGGVLPRKPGMRAPGG